MRRSTSWAVGLSIALGLTAAVGPSTARPASASAPADAEGSTTLLRGVLVRAERAHLESDDATSRAEHRASTTPGDAGGGVLLDVGGVSVPLDPSSVKAVATGSRLTVEVPVPGAVVRAAQTRTPVRVNAARTQSAVIPASALEAAEDVPAAAGSTLAAASAVSAATSGAPLDATVVTAGAAVAAASGPAHAVKVAVVTYQGLANPATDAQVQALVAGVSDYWSEQTDGAVTLAISGAIVRYATTVSCANYGALWDEAGVRTSFTRTADANLVVLLPDAAYQQKGCSYGLGEVGAGIHSGGRLYVSALSQTALAHEFGHNLSLMHANRLYCAGADAVRNKGCTSVEYGDRADVMSSSGSLTRMGNASAVALGRLGLLGDGRVTVVATGETTVTVEPLSGHTGVRSVAVTDPRSGDTYYLEDRQGTGRDTWGFGGATMAYGLRVLKVDADGHTQLLDPTPHAKSVADPDAVILPGTTFKTAADGVEVAAVANSDGSVDAKLSLAAVGEQHFPSSLAATTIGVSDASAALASTASVPITVTAADSSVVNGTVTVTETGAKPVSVKVAGGKGTLKVAAKALGTRTFALAFKPTTSVKAPSGLRYATAAVALTVTTIPSTLTAKAPAVKPTIAQAVSLPVTVAAKGATATGTVTATETTGGVAATLATATLVKGAAKLALPALALGDHSVTLTYSGDAKVAASTATLPLTAVALPVSVVTPSASTITTTATRAATVRVAVKVGTAAGTGTVALTEGSTSLGSATLSSGSATVTLPLLAAGSHTVTVTHVGPPTVTGGTATVTVTVTG